MDKKNLKIFARIKGIGSASGLFIKNNLLYVIGDNSAYLYEYNITTNALNKIEILKAEKVLENIAKADKPDFEVLCHYDDMLYILGSGSKLNRCQLISYQLNTHIVIQQDLNPVYSKIKTTLHIDDDNLNIEGAIFTGEYWFLFNRGNGSAKKNGIIKIKGKDIINATAINFTPIMLLKTNQVLVSFTDAILYENEIYFIAAAENTTNTYEDGEILGSYIGSINTENLKLNFSKKISNDKKFEGITFFKKNGAKKEFLLCEDRDTEVLETTIYRLSL